VDAFTDAEDVFDGEVSREGEALIEAMVVKGVLLRDAEPVADDVGLPVTWLVEADGLVDEDCVGLADNRLADGELVAEGEKLVGVDDGDVLSELLGEPLRDTDADAEGVALTDIVLLDGEELTDVVADDVAEGLADTRVGEDDGVMLGEADGDDVRDAEPETVGVALADTMLDDGELLVRGDEVRDGVGLAVTALTNGAETL
jgi:hypothetical protein